MADQNSSDYHNFTQPSSSNHRLPTLNGAQALFDAIEKHGPIPTGLAGLDTTLCSSDNTLITEGGVPRGSVTEIYGPPGCGKTHFAIQLAVNALRESAKARVVWIDTSSEVPYTRLKQFLRADPQANNGGTLSTGKEEDKEQPESEENLLDERLDHLYISSFPHFLALLLHPPQDFPAEDTSLIIVDGMSTIVLTGLPQNDRGSGTSAATPSTLSRDGILSRAVAARRAAMLSTVSSGLARLAASKNVSLVITNNTSSNRKPGVKNSVLRSALNLQHWNENITTRIVIYRDFWPAVNWSSLDRDEARKQQKRQRWPLRIAEVERLNGKEVSAQGIKFVILKDCLHAVDPPTRATVTTVAPPSSPPLPNEDNEEGMSNLGLRDTEEVEDHGLAMPEDVSSSPAAQAGHKRKIEEVGDSEEEDEIGLGSMASFPQVKTRHGGFLPSSQLTQDNAKDVNPSTEVTKLSHRDNTPHTIELGEDENEMLLQH